LLESLKVISNVTVRQLERIRLPIEAWLSQKLCVYYPQFYQYIWHQKIRIISYHAALFAWWYSHFDRTPACDGRTDRQTQGHSIYRAITSRV